MDLSEDDTDSIEYELEERGEIRTGRSITSYTGRMTTFTRTDEVERMPFEVGESGSKQVNVKSKPRKPNQDTPGWFEFLNGEAY